MLPLSPPILFARLLRWRWMAWGLALLGLAGAVRGLGLALPVVPMLGVLASMAVVNVADTLWLRHGGQPQARALLMRLVLDTQILGALLFLSGGANNPLVTLYLLPLVLAAVVLPTAWAWGLAAGVVLDYSLLMVYHWPLPETAADPAWAFRLHVVGMWLTFCVAAGLIVLALGRGVAALRQRDAALALAREQQLRDEKWVALGTLAAGAAHELSTPLSTLAVLIGEWQHASPPPAEQAADLTLMAAQVHACKAALQRLTAEAGIVRSAPPALPLDAQLERLLTGWRTLHPAAVMHYQPDTVPAPCVALDPRFAPALLNVLNNAAEASPTPIDLQATWHGGQLELTLVNQGAALPAVPLGSAWPPLGQSSQKGGLGLGMALTHATLAQLGGSVHWTCLPQGKVVTVLTLPLPSA